MKFTFSSGFDQDEILLKTHEYHTGAMLNKTYISYCISKLISRN